MKCNFDDFSRRFFISLTVLKLSPVENVYRYSNINSVALISFDFELCGSHVHFFHFSEFASTDIL